MALPEQENWILLNLITGFVSSPYQYSYILNVASNDSLLALHEGIFVVLYKQMDVISEP